VVPTKKINSATDVKMWQNSKAYGILMSWLRTLNESCKSKTNDTECVISESTKKVLEMLDKLSKLVEETPPLKGAMRYGNRAYRDWHVKMCDQAEALHEPFAAKEAIPELAPYLMDSFGNRTRIDYGTGHELHFVIWLYCLHAVGVFKKEDFTAIVCRIFTRYLILCRHLQQTYGQEPAGSRGVWCLDDYQFVPFIWGSAQLLDNTQIKPAGILQEPLVRKYADKYLYLSCIKYINDVKRGPFFEHSPDLFNISGAQSWEKINKGMFLKYNDDVLSKFPVLQHVLFGSLFPFP